MSKKKSSQINKLDRPLSPHLTIYKPQITSVLSITHRATGVFLTLGSLVLCWWIIALAHGAETYNFFQSQAGAWYGRILLFGWAFSLFYHLCNGIRHLFWDVGLGFDLKNASYSGWLVIIASVIFTLITWEAATGSYWKII